MILILRLIAALALLGFGIWGIGAIYFLTPLELPLKYAVMAVFALVFLTAVRAVFRRGLRGPAFLAASVAGAILLGWFFSLRPSDTLEWAPDVARRSLVTIEGDAVTIRNLRNFGWTGPYDGAEAWEERRLNLSDITTVDLMLSYWMGPDIAHMLVSFGTADGQRFAYSTEIRRRNGQEYDPLAGFFRSYTLNTIVAEESDIVKVRTNFRGEDVQRFRLDITPDNARRLFANYAALTQELERAPQFYNTVLDNCATAPWRMVQSLRPGLVPFDIRIITVGRLPEYLHELGLLEAGKSMAELRANASVTQRAKAAGALTGKAFSQAIRAP